MSLPRLTSALRAFSTVTPDYDVGEVEDGRVDADLERKRSRRRERELKESLSWKQLVSIMRDGMIKSKAAVNIIDKEVKSLSRAARTIGKFILCASGCNAYVCKFMLVLDSGRGGHLAFMANDTGFF